MTEAAVFSAGTLASAIVHGVALVFMFSAFGTLLFLTLVAPPAVAGMDAAEGAAWERRGSRLAAWSLALGVLAELAWLGVESGVLAGSGVAALVAAIPVVARDTEFGRLSLAQAAGLFLAFLVLSKRGSSVRARSATILSGIVVLLEAWHLHAAAMVEGVSLFLVCEAVHVLAGAAWLGSLLPLATFIRAAPPRAGVAGALRYSVFARPLVVALMVTAAWQGLVLVGGVAALFETPYGWMVLAKIVLFAALIVFALRHRFRLVPALAHANPDEARRALAQSILAETGFGIAIVLVAAVLASLAPPAMVAMAMP